MVMMISFRPWKKQSLYCAITLAGIAFVGCGQEPQPSLAILPGLLEEYPELDASWLAEALTETQASGIVVVEKEGRMRTQRLHGSLTPPIETSTLRYEALNWTGTLDIDSEDVVAQLDLPLVLIEPGGLFEDLDAVLVVSSYFRFCEKAAFSLWNQDKLFWQVTSPRVSHNANYPEYGLILFVETLQDEEGAWLFRWGNPRGYSTGSNPAPINEEPYPWASVRYLNELISVLSAQFKFDKTIHLNPKSDQPVVDVLDIIHSLQEAGFLYVDIQG